MVRFSLQPSAGQLQLAQAWLSPAAGVFRGPAGCCAGAPEGWWWSAPGGLVALSATIPGDWDTSTREQRAVMLHDRARVWLAGWHCCATTPAWPDSKPSVLELAAHPPAHRGCRSALLCWAGICEAKASLPARVWYAQQSSVKRNGVPAAGCHCDIEPWEGGDWARGPGRSRPALAGGGACVRGPAGGVVD